MPTNDLTAALDALAYTLGTEEIGDAVGGSMTCTEADTLARVMHLHGRTDDAASFLIGHSGQDDEGDAHRWPRDADGAPTDETHAHAHAHAATL